MKDEIAGPHLKERNSNSRQRSLLERPFSILTKIIMPPEIIMTVMKIKKVAITYL
jgi:hypothetical protein